MTLGVRLLLAFAITIIVLIMNVETSRSQNPQGGIFGAVGRALGIERDQACMIHHRRQRVEGGIVSGEPPNPPDTMFVGPDGRPQVLSREQCEQENERSLAAEESAYQRSIQQRDALVARPMPLPEGDPYPNASIVHRDHQQEAFLDFVRVTYFAMGCRVFQPPSANTDAFVQIVLTAQWRGLGSPDLPTAGLMETAKRDGTAKAAQPEGCEYWHQHPEAVYEMRRLGDLAFQ